MFHHVTNDDIEGVPSSCLCTIDEFKKIVAEVKGSVISIDELIDRIERKRYALCTIQRVS